YRQEMAFSLSWGAEVLSYFTERRFDAAACADLIFFQFDTGSEFYLETAKYRVFRRLWSLILDEYGVNSNPAIHALPSSFETSLYDPYSNLIRMSIQSLASILGGVDAVGNRSFDRMAPLHDIKQLRFSHDILQILRHESGIFNLKDPLMGSYSLSEIEMNLAEESFELFCRLEKQGGYFKCLQNGWIENEIRQNMELKKILLFEQKINITGVNSFINKNESRSVSERNGLSDGFRYQSRGLSFDEGMYGQMNSSEWMSKEMELVRFCADCLKSLSVKGPVVLVFCLKETEKNLLQKIRNTVDSIGCDMIVYNEANEFPSVSSDERSRIAGAVFIQTDFEVLKKVLSELDFRIPVFYDSEIREDVKGNIGRFPSGSYEEMTAFYERVSDFLRQRIDEEKS
ncbi:MAG: methylmalonyl-CoA mutase family protein, partial [Spirochaetia bacterium]|nr:methylmalonyl-CoA mutase family protein [Spirochaetia bacterium]